MSSIRSGLQETMATTAMAAHKVTAAAHGFELVHRRGCGLTLTTKPMSGVSPDLKFTYTDMGDSYKLTRIAIVLPPYIDCGYDVSAFGSASMLIQEEYPLPFVRVDGRMNLRLDCGSLLSIPMELLDELSSVEQCFTSVYILPGCKIPPRAHSTVTTLPVPIYLSVCPIRF